MTTNQGESTSLGTRMRDSAYVVKYASLYCRFGSYSSCAVVFSPIRASLYSRERDAQKRVGTDEHCWIDGVRVTGDKLSVVKVTFDMVEEGT